MLHCVHQLVTNFHGVMFDAGQTAYSGVFELLQQKKKKQLIRVLRVNHNSKIVNFKHKTMS